MMVIFFRGCLAINLWMMKKPWQLKSHFITLALRITFMRLWTYLSSRRAQAKGKSKEKKKLWKFVDKTPLEYVWRLPPIMGKRSPFVERIPNISRNMYLMYRTFISKPQKSNFPNFWFVFSVPIFSSSQHSLILWTFLLFNSSWARVEMIIIWRVMFGSWWVLVKRDLIRNWTIKIGKSCIKF